MTAPQASLHRKLAQVLLEVGRIPKNGKAPAQMGGYSFVQVGDAADAIREALAEKLLTMHPTRVTVVGQVDRPTKTGGNMTTVDLLVEWTITDAETGESIVIMSFGAGADGGDKYSGKAMTSAMKYAFLSGFLLSTGDDTEASNLPEQGRPAPDRLPPRQDVNTQEPPGRLEADAEPYEEEEELIGRERRRGMVRKSTSPSSDHYKLVARQGPDGHVFGFRLDVGKDKSIPQCLIAGPLGEALFVATGGNIEGLAGTPATVAGPLFYVRSNRTDENGKRFSWYRMHVDRIECVINGLEVILPADPEPVLPEPPEDVPLPFEKGTAA